MTVVISIMKLLDTNTSSHVISNNIEYEYSATPSVNSIHAITTTNITRSRGRKISYVISNTSTVPLKITKSVRTVDTFNTSKDPSTTDSDRSTEKPANFLIDTPSCKIPNIDPFDPIVVPFLIDVKNIECAVKYDIVYTKGHNVFINWTEVENSPLKGILQYCRYDVIWRPKNERHNHDFYKYLKGKVNFYSFITVKEDYIRVECFSANESVVYSNFFSFIHDDVIPSNNSNDDTFKKHQKAVDETLSVLMIGIDSVSRLNMIRNMNRTRSVLLQDMNAIELLGYTKVGENTILNLIPMLSGQFVKELPYNFSRPTSYDSYNFIWNDFKRAGYTTFYTEDRPDLATFDYYKKGFQYIPTDVYNRHFTVAMDDSPEIWNTDHMCIHARPEVLVHLQHMRQFVNINHRQPYFALNFMTRITHDYMENVKMLDDIYANLFVSLNKNNLLNNTVVIFFSDHGIRFGDFRETTMGNLEERLPFMFLIFPQWFLQKYKHIKGNLQTNRHRLTTPFDVYGTLVDILNFKADNKDISHLKRGSSLLQEIQYNRTCDDASITPHWCMCYQQQNVSVSNKAVVRLAEYLTTYINDLLIDVLDKCEHLTLVDIKSALRLNSAQSQENKKKAKKHQTVYTEYRLTIKTYPGNGVFEGTLGINLKEKDIRVVGDISRINLYGNQSHCVNNSILKNYCYCKIQE